MKNLTKFIFIFGIIVVGFWCYFALKSRFNNETNQIEVRPNTPKTTTNSGSLSSARKVTINQEKEFNGLNIKIGNVIFEPSTITLQLTISNKSKDVLAFYPNQKSVVVGKTQFDSKFASGMEVSGEINAGIEKTGLVEYENKSGDLIPDSIDKVGLRLGSIYNTKSMKSVDCNWDIEIPKN